MHQIFRVGFFRARTQVHSFVRGKVSANVAFRLRSLGMCPQENRADANDMKQSLHPAAAPTNLQRSVTQPKAI